MGDGSAPAVLDSASKHNDRGCLADLSTIQLLLGRTQRSWRRRPFARLHQAIARHIQPTGRTQPENGDGGPGAAPRSVRRYAPLPLYHARNELAEDLSHLAPHMRTRPPPGVREAGTRLRFRRLSDGGRLLWHVPLRRPCGLYSRCRHSQRKPKLCQRCPGLPLKQRSVSWICERASIRRAVLLATSSKLKLVHTICSPAAAFLLLTSEWRQQVYPQTRTRGVTWTLTKEFRRWVTSACSATHLSTRTLCVGCRPGGRQPRV